MSGQSASGISGELDKDDMKCLGLNKLGLTDELFNKVNVSDEDANLIKLGLQHVNVIIRYYDQTRIMAMTLTSLQKSCSFA